MSKTKILLLSSIASLFIFSGCQNIKGPEVTSSNLSVGKVQSHISKGMYSADVVKALGSPNIITKNKDGKITWVYDKIKTYHSKEHGGLSFVRMNANDFVIAGGIIAGVSQALKTAGKSNFLISAAALGLVTLFDRQGDYEYKTEQKTLTIVLDFDASEKLENFSYMYSSF